jgi:diadenosine tetraphosphatase ApaH/serine/threonine PP2A family protein phosphatase
MFAGIVRPRNTWTTPVRAILSDIHGNLEALTAVLADIERCGANEVYNLGDTLGYGPNPVECLDLARLMHLNLLGNFDYAVLHEPDGFCQAAERSVLWTQSRLQCETDSDLKEKRLSFLGGLDSRHRSGVELYVHGTAHHPLNEYLFPEDVYNPSKLIRIGIFSGQLCFAGHTHQPGVFTESEKDRWEFHYPEEYEPEGFAIKGKKVICNVGSVGQPRDGDERACYVLFDGSAIWFRRVEYDFETTVRKIYEIPELDNFLGDRLRDGR